MSGSSSLGTVGHVESGVYGPAMLDVYGGHDQGLPQQHREGGESSVGPGGEHGMEGSGNCGGGIGGEGMDIPEGGITCSGKELFVANFPGVEEMVEEPLLAPNEKGEGANDNDGFGGSGCSAAIVGTSGGGRTSFVDGGIYGC